MSGELIFQYDPASEPPMLEPGVTPGYVYLWSGEAGPALVAKATAVTDDDGHGFIDFGDFSECTVVDDERQP